MRTYSIILILLIAFHFVRAQISENSSPFDHVVARGTNFTVTSADIDANRAWNRIIYFAGRKGNSNLQESEAYALNTIILWRIAMQQATIEDHRKADQLSEQFFEKLGRPMRSPLATSLPQFQFAQTAAEFRRTLLAFGLKSTEFTNIVRSRGL